ncbi:MAG: hypothetical protein KBE65_03295 [Phycisphaerae bacterium]|nr:hypothetical protein [Phycisphaerae bacterium]
MKASCSQHVCLIVAFLAMVAAVAVSQVVFDLREGDTPEIVELFRQPPTPANLRRIETRLENGCELAQMARPWMQFARFVLLEDTGDKALLGRDGWFFYRPAVQYLVEPVRSVPVRAYLPSDEKKVTPDGVTTNARDDLLDAIVSFRDDLAKRGIRLLVMPAPNKASVCPEMLAARAAGMTTPVNPTTRGVLARLEQAGVEVVDLFEVFGKACQVPGSPACYLAQDSHWSPEGMRLAAQTVARRLLDSGLVEKGTTAYDLKSVPVERHGDVLQMIRVPQVERLFEPQRMDCTQVIDSGTGKPYMDDPNSPILVLGDSFLRIFERDEPGSGGFVAHLAYNLGFGLSSIISDGGASTLVRQQLARKPALLNGKKVVIWEFVERDIRFGTEGWQVIPLP